MSGLPLFLEEQTEEAVMQRMLSLLPSNLDKSEGSDIWDFLSPSAVELAQAAIWAQEILRRAFASTTFGSYLDLRCEEHGVYRRPATYSRTDSVWFKGKAGTIIPKDYIVSTENVESTPSILFRTVSEVVVGVSGEVSVEVEAIEPGAAGNVSIGAIKHLTDPIQGITSVENKLAATGGSDIESDSSLLNRFLMTVRSPGTSGNKADYIRWALEVPGVGGVQVEPLWNGPGTVKVVLLDANKRSPNSEIVGAVQNYISPLAGAGEGQAPIGADVIVVAAEEVPINIKVQLTLASGADLQEVEAIIEDGLLQYLESLAFSDPLVRYIRISAILLSIPPIIDFSNLLVNDLSDTNIEIGQGQVAVPGSVIVYE